MAPLTIKSVVTQAHHPRAFRGSTLNADDTLQIVYNLYSDPRYANSKVKGTHSQVNLAFAHGIGFSKDAWNYIIELFFEAYGDKLGTVVAIDTVNHSDSYILNKDKLGWICAWEDYARDILKVLRELNLKGGTILVGHSMGGATSLHAAALDRRLIDSVVTIEPVCYVDKDMYYNSKAYRDTLYKLLLSLNRSMTLTFPTKAKYDSFMRKKYLTKTFHPRVLDDLLRTNTVVDPATGETSYKTPKNQHLVSYAGTLLSCMNLQHIVKTIDCEVCHIIGAAAGWNPPEAATMLRANLPYCTPVDIPNGQHLVSLDMPDETFKAMQPFIEKRIKRIEEIARDEYAHNPVTLKEREEFFMENVAKADELFSSGKKLMYNRL